MSDPDSTSFFSHAQRVGDDPVLGRHLEAAGPGLPPGSEHYVADVRAAVGRFALRSAASEGVRGALTVLQDLAEVDTDVPIMGRTRSIRYVKTGVKAAAGWYLRYLGGQVSSLGRATADLGAALVERTDRLEEAEREVAARASALEDRVSRLEMRLGDGSGGAQP